MVASVFGHTEFKLGFFDVKRVAVGRERTRSEALLFAQLLRNHGVPAVAEISGGWHIYTDLTWTRIFVEVSLLKEEHIAIIREILGERMSDISLQKLEEHFAAQKLEPLPPPEATVVVARFFECKEAAMYCGLLRVNGIECDVVPVEAGHALALFTDVVTRRQIKLLQGYLGVHFDPKSLVPK